MDTNSTAGAQRVSRRAARNIAVIGVVSCLAVLGFAAAVTGAGPALSTQINIVSVDHTHKGDRLPLVPQQASKAPVACSDDAVGGLQLDVNRPLAAPLTRSVRASRAVHLVSWGTRGATERVCLTK